MATVCTKKIQRKFVTVLSPKCDTLARVNPSLVRELGRGTEGRPGLDPNATNIAE